MVDIGECAEAAKSSMSDEWKVWAQNCIKAEPPGRRLLTLAKFRIQAPVEFGPCGDCYKKAAIGKSQTHSEDLRKQKKNLAMTFRCGCQQQPQSWGAVAIFVLSCHKSWIPDENSGVRYQGNNLKDQRREKTLVHSYLLCSFLQRGPRFLSALPYYFLPILF